jgi:cytochrome b
MTRVWDVPTRFVHWAIVILLGISWWTAENHEMEWHQRSGLMLCMLVVFRIVWGFIGGSTARFAQFLKGPATVIAYLKSSGPWRGLGHNPVGAWSAVLLILILVSQIVTGLFAVDVDGIESGPLSYMVDFDQGRLSASIHEINFNVILTLSALHIVAIFFYLRVRKRNLIGPMVSGAATGDHVESGLSLTPAPLWRLAIAVAISFLVTSAASKGFQF